MSYKTKKDIQKELDTANAVSNGLIVELGNLYLKARKIEKSLKAQDRTILGIAGQYALDAKLGVIEEVFGTL